MKKISFISTNKSAWGGSEYLWYYAALRLAKDGYNVNVSIPRWRHIPVEILNLESKNIKVRYNTDNSNIKKIINRILPATHQLSYAVDGYKFLKHEKPDLTIINQGGNTGGLALMEFCVKNNFKFVTIAQAANEASWPTDRISYRLSDVFPKALKNYFVSKANLRLTEIQIGRKIPNAEVIYNPFNTDFRNNMEYPDPGEIYSLANVARHEYYAKGQDILFQVLNEKKWRERNLEVNLYGKGDHTNSIVKLKKYFGLEKVNVCGHVNVSEIWGKNQALILTSRYEGLPLALVEAMLCSRLGIVTAVSGNPEIVIDNVNGFLAKAAEVSLVDEALERAWARRSEWKEIGKKARENIVKLIPEDPVGYFCEKIRALN